MRWPTLNTIWPESISRGGFRTMLGVPLLREGLPSASSRLSRSAVEPFTDKQIELVTTFADQAVIAIENVRLFDEVQKRTRELSEALEQQTAMSEVLRVISSSSTELAPVFDTILANATRLCEGNFAALWQYDGEALVGVAQHNLSPGFAELCRNTKLWPGPEGAIRKAALERRPIHVADITAEFGIFAGRPPVRECPHGVGGPASARKGPGRRRRHLAPGS